jgi:hypothetical protein
MCTVKVVFEIFVSGIGIDGKSAESTLMKTEEIEIPALLPMGSWVRFWHPDDENGEPLCVEVESVLLRIGTSKQIIVGLSDFGFKEETIESNIEFCEKRGFYTRCNKLHST